MNTCSSRTPGADIDLQAFRDRLDGQHLKPAGEPARAAASARRLSSPRTPTGLGRRSSAPARCLKILGDGPDPLRQSGNQRKVLVTGSVSLALEIDRGIVGIGADRRDRLIDLMGDTGRDLAEDRQPVGIDQILLHPLCSRASVAR